MPSKTALRAGFGFDAGLAAGMVPTVRLLEKAWGRPVINWEAWREEKCTGFIRIKSMEGSENGVEFGSNNAYVDESEKSLDDYAKSNIGDKIDMSKERRGTKADVAKELAKDHELYYSVHNLYANDIWLSNKADNLMQLLSKAPSSTSRVHLVNFGVDAVEDFKEYTLRDHYCWYKLKLLDNAAERS
nr:hypothetical protein [Tanacetum cinerariifolium]